MTIDKQKLLQWIEDKRYVYTVDYYDHKAGEDPPAVVSTDKGRLSMLNMLQRAIELGEFKQE